jgi:hypothetical protein
MSTYTLTINQLTKYNKSNIWVEKLQTMTMTYRLSNNRIAKDRQHGEALETSSGKTDANPTVLATLNKAIIQQILLYGSKNGHSTKQSSVYQIVFTIDAHISLQEDISRC